MNKKSILTAATSLLTLASVVLVSSPANASPRTPLEAAACEYRDAVLVFEREVNRAREFGRDYERLADELEDASGRLRSATRNTRRPERLLRAWAEVRYLQPHVEQTFFSLPPTRTLSVLAIHWDRVLCAYDALAVELQCVSHPHARAAIPVRQPFYAGRSVTTRRGNSVQIGATLQRRFD